MSFILSTYSSNCFMVSYNNTFIRLVNRHNVIPCLQLFMSQKDEQYVLNTSIGVQFLVEIKITAQDASKA